MADRAKDRTIPLVLIGVGIAIYLIVGLTADEPAATLAAIAVVTGVQVALGLIALYVTAGVMHIDFGPLGIGILKLAAIFIFPDAVAVVIPTEVLDWLVAAVLYLSLLAWFFDLEPLELLVCATVIFLVRLFATIVIIGMLMASA